MNDLLAIWVCWCLPVSRRDRLLILRLNFLGNGEGYSLQYSGGSNFLSLTENGVLDYEDLVVDSRFIVCRIITNNGDVG